MTEEPGAAADGWADRLGRLVDQGSIIHGEPAVAELLEKAARGLRARGQARRSTLDVVVPVLGVAACETGWVGVLLHPDAPPSVHLARGLATLVDLALEQGQVHLVAIDAPEGARRSEGQPHGPAPVRAGVEVIEVRPAEALAELTGSQARSVVEDDLDPAVRRAALEAVGLVAPVWFRGSGFTEDELLRACVAAWSATRRLSR